MKRHTEKMHPFIVVTQLHLSSGHRQEEKTLFTKVFSLRTYKNMQLCDEDNIPFMEKFVKI